MRTTQKITSQFSFIISHGKRTKDSVLIREGPKVRKNVESFLHHTKSILAKNSAAESFWSGNYSNRNIDGTRIEMNEEEQQVSDTESEAESEQDCED